MVKKYIPLSHQLPSFQIQKIPTTNLQAWKKYPLYRNVYNKLTITLWSNLSAQPMHIIPTKYPIVVKRILNITENKETIQIVHNKKEFSKT